MTNSEEWYGKMADNENSILKESYGNMTLSCSGNYCVHSFFIDAVMYLVTMNSTVVDMRW